ncbi:uncharacterized protein OCT59_028305 [Rhizophagus irregularis]|uniref:F-box domain-containing protein n=2 Tax=Rhizophagus irregularis TaxID=588596 RepID=A0A015K1R4_RHIIW|nr:hypothetical protein GLOIN_2v1677339 [Rhizophagus irregularis DAOM 181602=DAOM 197198]EXX75692.1 hypothetical protein RirG_039730 [Rhizophagus irregularis DAOM 197198w]UZO08038.1 hypothetical protein OCT59_028305 [Rhizophagus irregularis]POG64247.1 hypothetical protein GLOIN_2v1677339 [Rhizophagus irregularis DAOM 181602=DAOM 197198]CAB4398341.1 unnamed protein product [Rhizophagus irregularis]CAB5384098.1 unnamed protein product [Rhizophagus irregularis]|eukprot:XP_025171113.1 hypothetical protein GLOIN_2v1677339 [Rhizophagus irregularis DAOM 181602=DAOM 197198]
MTSLIFMLPETMCPILDYIRYDRKSLYSCMFVNRTWCSLTTPILWRAPFKESRSSLITTFIRCLDRTSKGKLRLFDGFPLEALKKPTFNYMHYIHELQYPTLYDSVKTWCDENYLIVYIDKEKEIYLNPTSTILDMLIERIMSKAKRLSELSIPTVTHRKGDYVCLIKHSSAAKKCLPKLRYLICDNCVPKNLLFASEFCINLNRLDIDCSWINDREVSKFLKAQKNLKQLTVTKRWPHLNDAISIDNLSISLRCVVLKDNCHRQNGGTLSVLKSFTNLEILRFHNWASFPENDIEGLTSCYFPRLRKLSFTHCKPTVGMIIPMILINGSSLQELTLSWEINQSDQYSVIRTIASNCPNLEYLDVPIVRKDVSNLHYVLKSCKKLESLTINSASDDDYDVDDFFPSMGNIIPEPLYQLNIFAYWKFTAESLSEFLKNCKNNLSCLGFYRSATDEHLKVITEYANERKSLSFLELRWCEVISLEEIKNAEKLINVIAVYNHAGRRI